jgi:hypothetical protein
MNYFSTSIDELTEWFRNYQVESIEVWISSRIVESTGIARLIYSFFSSKDMYFSLTILFFYSFINSVLNNILFHLVYNKKICHML